MVRTRFKEARVHARVVAKDDVLVFLRGVVPEPDDVFTIVVFTLFRIATNKPDQFNIGLGE